jgi:CHAT domain-containing protein
MKRYVSEGSYHYFLNRTITTQCAWLVVRFYQAYLAGESAAEALSIAQTWLQALTYPDLIHWLEQLQTANPLGKYCQKEIAAQITLLNQEMGTMGQSAKPYAHPYYWVGFILTGGRPT